MTTVEKIKAKILDLAIRGKLVPQDPNDEPASVLLERIKAEKAKLVKAKKIKKDKNPSEIVVGADGATYEKFADGTSKDISDELPFDLPQGWAWARLKNIAYVATGKTPSKNAFVDRGVPYIKMYNIRRQMLDFDFHPQFITREVHNTLLARSRLVPHDLLMNIVGPPLGKLAIVPESIQEGNFNQAAVMIRPYLEKVVINEYLYYYLWQMDEINFLDTKGTAGQDNISLTQAQHMRIAVPPLVEQKRIVAKIKELFAYAEKINDAADSIGKTAERIEKKILDLAICGQLVPQDPNDEPASELVRRIEAARKIKAGGKKSRATASDRPAYEIDPPFDIPDSWAWVRLGEVLLPMSTIHPTGKYFRYIDIDAIDNKSNTVLAPKQLSVAKAPSRASRGLQTGDTLFSVVRPYLRNIAYISDSLSDCIASTGFYVCRPSEAVESKFLFWLLLSDYVVNGLNAFMKGDNSPSIRVEQLYNYPIPLPPIAEQKRIVSKIAELRMLTRKLVTL